MMTRDNDIGLDPLLNLKKQTIFDPYGWWLIGL